MCTVLFFITGQVLISAFINMRFGQLIIFTRVCLIRLLGVYRLSRCEHCYIERRVRRIRQPGVQRAYVAIRYTVHTTWGNGVSSDARGASYSLTGGCESCEKICEKICEKSCEKKICEKSF